MRVVAASEHEYDEFLAVHIELAKPIDRATATKLNALYTQWQKRIERASRAMAKADDDDEALGTCARKKGRRHWPGPTKPSRWGPVRRPSLNF